MLKLKCITPSPEGTVEDPKIETILVNPDHVVCITAHETNPKWSRVNLLDDYEFIVEGSPTELDKLPWRQS